MHRAAKWCNISSNLYETIRTYMKLFEPLTLINLWIILRPLIRLLGLPWSSLGRFCQFFFWRCLTRSQQQCRTTFSAVIQRRWRTRTKRSGNVADIDTETAINTITDTVRPALSRATLRPNVANRRRPNAGIEALNRSAEDAAPLKRTRRAPRVQYSNQPFYGRRRS